MAKVDNFKGFLKIGDNEKKILLKSLGYDVLDNGFVVAEGTNKLAWCRYTNKPIRFEEASILPGSTIIINTTPISLSSYIEEFLEEDV